MTLTIAVVVSAIVSLTLTPMMCARLLRAHQEGAEGRLSRIVNAPIDAMEGLYRTSLDRVLRHQPATLLVTLADGRLQPSGSTSRRPKGFLPLQDTGFVTAIFDAGPEVSFDQMTRLQAAATETIAKDPDVTGVIAVVGVSPLNQTPNAGHLKITLRDRGAEKIDDHGDHGAAADQACGHSGRDGLPAERAGRADQHAR